MPEEERLPKCKNDLAVFADFATGESTPEWRCLMARLLSPASQVASESEQDHDEVEQFPLQVDTGEEIDLN